MPGVVQRLKRPPAQVLVKLRDPHPDRVQLEGLGPDIIVVRPRKASIGVMVKKWRENNKTKSMTRTFKTFQVPMALAYAVTDYRSQGETVQKVIGDFKPPSDGRGGSDHAAPYVVASRVPRQEGFALLRSFPLSAIASKDVDDLAEQDERFKKLEEGTIRWLRQVRYIENLTGF
jgi:hypothetical protein